MNNNKGFTLIEFIVVGVIVSIVATTVVPSFVRMAGQSRTTASANEMLNIVQSAKIEAIRSHSNVVVCASSTGQQCDDNWRNVILFVDKDEDEQISGDEVVKRFANLSSENDHLKTSNGDVTSLSFDRLGMLQDASGGVELVSFCSSLYPKESKTIVVGVAEAKIEKSNPSGQQECP